MTEQGSGEGLVAELKWVHGMIRRDLEAVRWLADQLENGMPGPDAAAAVADLAIGGALWQLKINCLQYCRFVHMHHHAESAMLFPLLRQSDPALGPVVDKLEADHTRVSDLLDEVSAAAAALADREDAGVRKRLVVTLAELSEDLLAHLQFEEDNISATLRTWTSWGNW